MNYSRAIKTEERELKRRMNMKFMKTLLAIMFALTGFQSSVFAMTSEEAGVDFDALSELRAKAEVEESLLDNNLVDDSRDAQEQANTFIEQLKAQGLSGEDLKNTANEFMEKLQRGDTTAILQASGAATVGAAIAAYSLYQLYQWARGGKKDAGAVAGEEEAAPAASATPEEAAAPAPEEQPADIRSAVQRLKDSGSAFQHLQDAAGSVASTVRGYFDGSVAPAAPDTPEGYAQDFKAIVAAQPADITSEDDLAAAAQPDTSIAAARSVQSDNPYMGKSRAELLQLRKRAKPAEMKLIGQALAAAK
jgi:hypothetical protein